MAIALHWFRRDLRLGDHHALAEAGAAGRAVVGCFVVDPRILERPDTGGPRVAHLLGALAEVDAGLRRHGSALVVRHGDAVTEVPRLARELGADVVTAVRDAEPFARDRDRRVDAALRAEGRRLRLSDEQTIAVLREVVKPDGSPYTVFTPFRRRVESLLAEAGPGEPGRPALDRLVPRDRLPASAALPEAAALGFDPGAATLVPGESAALSRLTRFVEASAGLRRYHELRNRADLDATSHLSADLRFGAISVRTVLRAAAEVRLEGGAQAAEAVAAWVGELIWRDFYQAVLWHFPAVEHESFRADLRGLDWEPDPDGARLGAWAAGRTGYPIVDASMRQLTAEGWMPNRCRMIVASFLTKDLHLDWRLGENHFMRHLVDGDLAANNGGWQWTASTGTDPQPYFRIFNPVLQGERWDPDGGYVRRWLPELAQVPASSVHKPWRLGPLERAGCGLAPGRYPDPIVDHERERAVALARYGRALGREARAAGV